MFLSPSATQLATTQGFHKFSIKTIFLSQPQTKSQSTTGFTKFFWFPTTEETNKRVNPIPKAERKARKRPEEMKNETKTWTTTTILLVTATSEGLQCFSLTDGTKRLSFSNSACPCFGAPCTLVQLIKKPIDLITAHTWITLPPATGNFFCHLSLRERARDCS